MAHSHSQPQPQAQGTLGSYVAGFVLAVLLTAGAFGVVMHAAGARRDAAPVARSSGRADTTSARPFSLLRARSRA